MRYNRWILAVLGLLLASPASAFDLVNTLPAADVWLQLLQQLAPVGPVPAPPSGMEAPWQAPLIQAFTVFNTSLLVVAGMILAWHTIIGTVASAQEGKTLGSKWHTIWAPLRVTTGIAFLAPLASGFGAAQLLVIQLAVWGGGLANDVWSGYVKFFGDREQIEASFRKASPTKEQAAQETAFAMERIKQTADAQGVLLSVLEKQVCVLSQKVMYDKAMYNVNAARPPGAEPITWDRIAKGQLTSLEKRILNGEFGDDDRVFFNFWSRYTPAIDSDGSIKTASIEVLKTGVPRGQVIDGAALLRERNPQSWALIKHPVPAAVYDFGPICGRLSFDIAKSSLIKSHKADLEGKVEGGTTWTQNVVFGAEPMSQDALDKFFAEIGNLTNTFVNGSTSGSPKKDYNGFDVIVSDLANVAALIVLGTYEPGFDMGLLRPNGTADQLFAKAANKYARLHKELTVQYNGTVSKWAAGYNIDKMLTRLGEQGWASAGMFYTILAKLQSITAQPLDVQVTDTETDWTQFRKVHPTYLSQIFGPRSVTELFVEYRNSVIQNTGDVEVDKFIDAIQKDNGNWFSNASSVITDLMGIDIIDILNIFHVDPHSAMLDVVGMGHNMINYGGAGIAATSATKVIAGAVSKVPNPVAGTVAGAGEAVAESLQIGFMILVAIGVIHSYVLPMLPYIMMLFAVLGMVILVAEALVAAPLWALFHVRMDGQDFVDGAQKPGYMIAFNLFLRPVLIIFGLILSFGVFGSLVWFTNLTFNTAGKSLLAGSGDLLGIAVMIGILTYLHYQITIRSFTLINQVPDRVVRWFGQGGENLGEQGDAEGATNVIMGGTSRRVESGVRFAAAKASTPSAGKESAKAAAAGGAKTSGVAAEAKSRPGPSANGH